MDYSAGALERRIGLYAATIGGLYVLLLVIGLSSGWWLVDRTGLPKMMDFLPMWAAGHEVATGAASHAYDPVALRQLELDTVGLSDSDAHFNFNYPPPFLFALAPLGALPYLAAELLWIGLQFCFFLGVVYWVVRRWPAVSIAAAMPLTLWGLFTVQSGFLASGLMGSALYFIERRPVLAGAFLGLLSYKPHFGILFPIILACAGHWRAFASAAVTVLALIALSIGAFGLGAWSGFSAALAQAGTDYLELGGPWGWRVIQSVYGLARWLGAGPTLAWTCHALVAVAITILVCAMWRRADLSYNVKAAALAAAALMVTPYLYAYDLVALAIPVAFLARDMADSGVLRGERALLIALYFGSVALIPFLVWLPIAPLALGALMALLIRRSPELRRAATGTSRTSMTGDHASSADSERRMKVSREARGG
jgi:hypothetical protein